MLLNVPALAGLLGSLWVPQAAYANQQSTHHDHGKPAAANDFPYLGGRRGGLRVGGAETDTTNRQPSTNQRGVRGIQATASDSSSSPRLLQHNHFHRGLNNLVTNGDFEDDPITNWANYGTSGYTVDTTFKHSGSQSIKITNGGAKQWVSLTAAAGEIVTIKGYSKAVGTSTTLWDYGIYADVEYDNGADHLWGQIASFDGGTHDFEYGEKTFTVPEGKTVTGVNVYAMYRDDTANPNGVAYFDDIEVSASYPLATDLINPERGFYHHTESFSSDPSPLNLNYLKGIREGGRTLILRLYYLDSFMGTDDISSTFLNQMKADFQTMIDAGVKCVLRFAYYKPADWPDTSGSVTEPEASRILSHIEDLAPTLQEWTHAIFAVQTGLIGPWGEGHSSTHFRCSAAKASTHEIVENLVDAVPGRQVQVRYPNFKPANVLHDAEAAGSMTVMTNNLIWNPDFETADQWNSATGASGWWTGVGAGPMELTSVTRDFVTSNGIKVPAGSSAAQWPTLTASQGASGNIIKIFGNSKLVPSPTATFAEQDYSVYVDVSFTEGPSLWGQVASFCGSGTWEYAETYLEVPTGRTVSSLSVHLMYRGAGATGYALFDDIGIKIFNAYNTEVTATTAFDGSDKSSMGHHNDCFLATDTDQGTYTSGKVESEQDYLETETKFTSMGGETCAVNAPRSTCPTAKDELAKFHYSYLNQDYNLGVLNSWTTGDCMDEIKSRLGYQMVVTSKQVTSSTVAPGGDLSYTVTLKNQGYARPIYDRMFRLKFISDSQECTVEDPSVDVNKWYASATDTYTVSGVASLPADIPAGSYNVYLDLADDHVNLTDVSGFKMAVANANMFDSATGLNNLGLTVTVDGASTTGTGQNAVTCVAYSPPAQTNVITENLIWNPDFETADQWNSATGASGWWTGIGSGSMELTTTGALTGSSLKVPAGSSTAQWPTLTAAQGASGNILKIYGKSKMVGTKPSGWPYYSLYVDVKYTDNTYAWGKTALFCGSGDWDSADTYFSVPPGMVVQSLSVHLMFAGTGATGYALFDDVGITIFDSAYDGPQTGQSGC